MVYASKLLATWPVLAMKLCSCCLLVCPTQTLLPEPFSVTSDSSDHHTNSDGAGVQEGGKLGTGAREEKGKYLLLEFQVADAPEILGPAGSF